MTDRELITDEELHAFTDGELDALRAADVAVLLQYHPDLQQRLAAFRDDKAMIAAIYGPLIDRPLPAAWHGMIARGRRPVLSRRGWMAAAASAALAFAGWETYSRLRSHEEDALIAEALAAREQTAAAAMAASGDRGEVDRALGSNLGMRVKAPDMAKYGFSFAGYRVYSGVAGGRAVRLDYQDAQKRLFTLYLRHSAGEEHFDMTKRGQVRVCVWQDEVLSAVMLAEVNAGEMLRLATLAYAGLSA